MKIKNNNFLMWLLIISPILDNINGFLLLIDKNVNISSIFKTIIFLFCMYIIITHLTNRISVYIFAISFFFIVQFIFFSFFDSGGFGYNLSTLIRLLIPFTIILAFQRLSVKDKTTVNCIIKVGKFYCWFFPLSLLFPMMFGFGFSTYVGDLGYKGFYYAGNEISVLMIMIFAISLQSLKAEKSWINLLNLILNIISIFLIGTKTVYIAVIILLVTALYVGRITDKKILSIILFVPVGIFGIWYVFTNLKFFQQIIAAWRWRYVYQGTGILDFLLSGRGEYLEKALHSAYSEKAFSHFVTGLSPNLVVNQMNNLVEMDIIDLILWFGVIVTFFIIVVYASYLKKAIQLKNPIYIIDIFLVYGTSIMAGHVIFAPMVTLVFAVMYLNIEFTEKPKMKEEIVKERIWRKSYHG